MSITIPDHAEALRAYILDVADTAAGTEGRVYGAEIPKSEHVSMPRRAIVLRDAGGYERPFTWGDVEIGEPRIDMFCFGETFYEAKAVWRAVHPHLRRLRRVTINNTLLHSVQPSSGAGPTHSRDSDTRWPFVLASYMLIASEVPVN